MKSIAIGFSAFYKTHSIFIQSISIIHINQDIDVPFTNGTLSTAKIKTYVRDMILYNKTFMNVDNIESDSSILIQFSLQIASESLKEAILSKINT